LQADRYIGDGLARFRIHNSSAHREVAGRSRDRDVNIYCLGTFTDFNHSGFGCITDIGIKRHRK
jgi:hypothetical protein